MQILIKLGVQLNGMFRKITVLSLTMLAFLLVEHNSFAQEEGGADDKSHEEVIVQKDSSMIFESGEVERVVQPSATPFNIPVKEAQKKNTLPGLENSVEKPTSEDQVKPKETKQDFSFNIIYYLIYKFKQVDN